jgi:hypothetical protein
MIEISRQSTDEDEVILYRSVSGNHIYFQILLNEESIILLIVDKETDTIVEFVVDNKSFTYFYGLETWLLRNVISEFRTLDIGNFKFFSKIADSKNLFEFDMVSNTIKKPPQKIRYQPLEINQVMVSELLNISTLSTLTTSLFASGKMGVIVKCQPSLKDYIFILVNRIDHEDIIGYVWLKNQHTGFNFHSLKISALYSSDQPETDFIFKILSLGLRIKNIPDDITRNILECAEVKQYAWVKNDGEFLYWDTNGSLEFQCLMSKGSRDYLIYEQWANGGRVLNTFRPSNYGVPYENL